MQRGPLHLEVFWRCWIASTIVSVPNEGERQSETHQRAGQRMTKGPSKTLRQEWLLESSSRIGDVDQPSCRYVHKDGCRICQPVVWFAMGAIIAISDFGLGSQPEMKKLKREDERRWSAKQSQNISTKYVCTVCVRHSRMHKNVKNEQYSYSITTNRVCIL